MKKMLFIALAALLLLPMVAQDRRYNMYGVMFYNLENLFDTINSNGTYDLEFSPNGARQWNNEKYWQKQHNMAYAISQITTQGTPDGPALIGVSEIENITVLQDLVRQPEIKNRRYQIVHHDSPDRRGVDVGLLYNPRVFKVLNVTNQRLGEQHFVAIGKGDDYNPNMRTRDQLCVTGMLAGEKVSVLVNHWPSRLGGQEQSSYLREATAQMARQTIDSLLCDDPNQGIFFMGDLNDDPQDRSCAQVLQARRDMSEVVTPNDLYNPWWKMLDKGIGTLAYKGQWNLFDQIVCNGYFLRHYEGKDKPQLTFLRAEVLNRDFLKTDEGDRQGYPLRTYSGGVFLNGYSDHFPTIIYLVKEVK
ncbi:MAG: endonuclease/exonuclease/phosphatase family protein [Muribaculaceae bacterium]|nr:endonuclease/exonuclease/phosphatase family protein [Muribaculaceae bacterium]